jgi:hypothetical protein
MSAAINHYLDRVMAVADIQDVERERHVRAELRDHLEAKVEALTENGTEPSEAIISAIGDHGDELTVGYGLRERRFLDVRLRGEARGVIAIGPRATGIIAIGGFARGIFACGGVAVGVFSLGGFSVGLLSFGGFAAGLFAYGGFALGLLALGGMAMGMVAAGGAAGALYVSSAGKELFSYYSAETAPTFLKFLGDNLNALTINQSSKTYFILIIVFQVVFFACIAVQVCYLQREGRRISKISRRLL